MWVPARQLGPAAEQLGLLVGVSWLVNLGWWWGGELIHEILARWCELSTRRL